MKLKTVSAAITLIVATLLVGTKTVNSASDCIEGTINVAGSVSSENVVVYIQQATGTFIPGRARMDQVSMKFTPHVLPVVVGTTVSFPNSDPVPHIVFSPEYGSFNLGVMGPGQQKEQTFGTCAKFPCVYTILCPIHVEMMGYIIVLQNPFFALTDERGHYKIDNVPPGNYTLGMWHERGRTQTRPVTVGSGVPATIDAIIPRR